MNRPLLSRFLLAGAALSMGLLQSAAADVSDLLFTVKITGDPNTPVIQVTNNSPTLEITKFEMTIGDVSRNFDNNTPPQLTAPPGGTITQTWPLSSGSSNRRGDSIVVTTTGFGPGKTIAIPVDVDSDSGDSIEDFSTVFFNNGANVPNTVATVYAGAASASRTFPESPASYTFRGPSRLVKVTSKTDSLTESVRAVNVICDGVTVATNVTEANVDAAHGDRIQITVPKDVYRDIHADYIGSSSDADAAEIEERAEERFTAIGMSVNNVAQTADPTRYDFNIERDTDVQVKWQQYYALTVRHDFSKTQSIEEIAGKPWAGPLASEAAGNPNPAAAKHWILRGTQPVVQIDGAVVDSTHPGLDIRYVVEGYRAFGPANSAADTKTNDKRKTIRTADGTVTTAGVDIRTARDGLVASYASAGNGKILVTTSAAHGIPDGGDIQIYGSEQPAYNGIFKIELVSTTSFRISATLPAGATVDPVARGLWKDATYVRQFAFQTVEPRQQIKPNFSMDCPAGVTYVWQIQYGVRANADDVSRVALTKVYEVTGSGDIDRTVQDGVSWFNPGARVKVVSAAKEAGINGLSMTAWANGDGYYFASQGEIDPSSGLPVTGAPASVNGSPVATWIGGSGATQLGYDIPNLQRPVRVLWRYGAGAIAVNVVIGKHVFEDYPQYATLFTRKPELISKATPDPIATAPGGVAPSAELMAEWDPINSRLYPTIPGSFTVPWKPGTDGVNAIEVRVTATLPYDAERGIRGHYPHIQGAPPVALDPDPEDDVAFKSIKHTTAGASVDAQGRFSTANPGITVLLFSQIQRIGRGQPREFLNVRVVDTRAWNTNLPAVPTTVTVGQKIVDSTMDRAKLGTGYLLDLKGRARYNPFIYDASKLEGIAAKDIYDMALLRADNSSLTVLSKTRLPGPIIPVNIKPGANVDELPIVVWYDDPRKNDTLLWPFAARIYKPEWPAASTLPRIVIASQFGSESRGPTDKDQQVAPALGTYPEAVTFNPSRLQAVQIYSQPDPAAPGYNPNEEHALVAPSLRYADVSPRPPAIYALRTGDLNGQDINRPADYTSHPYVLVQYQDLADNEVKMKLYAIKKETTVGEVPSYKFASNFAANTATLKNQPYVKMRAGEPVIPFYPIGVAVGASPPPQTFGNNIFTQEAYWEDWRGSYWSISGGDKAWFESSFYYPLSPDFWWPSGLQVPGVKVTKNKSQYTASSDGTSKVPGVGDAVAFLPAAVGSATFANQLPTKVLYKSEWPENPPTLKAGETLTFSGGEYRADRPTTVLVKDGVSTTVDTPGLPQLTAFASAEVVFDSLNPEGETPNLLTQWTARVVQSLDKRTAPLPTTAFPSELQPASGRTTVSQGKYIFNELPASLQRRLRYDALNGVLEFSGLLNDKKIGDTTLTAAPPAVYLLEPNILTEGERDSIKDLVTGTGTVKTDWDDAVDALYDATRNPEAIDMDGGLYLAGLMKTPSYGPDGRILKDQLGNVIYTAANKKVPTPLRAYGPGLALIPNGGFLDPLGKINGATNYPDISYVTVVENNDPTLGGSPITPYIVKVDRTNRYRGSIKTILSDNVFDENIVLRSTGDFGANADDLVFEWWYRPDDGSLNVPPPDLIPAGQTSPWKVYPDPTGKNGLGRYQITLKGNPNAPEALLADTFWFVRYRHTNDTASGTNWKQQQPDGRQGVNFTWAGAGNSQPFVDADLDGFMDFRAQLAQGWIKRVLDAVNPYEARIRNFEGDAPSTIASMIAQFGPRYEGPVALNPSKNVIENVGLIELYETILDRGRKLSIDLSQPVSTPAIANALQLASTRISDFYNLLGNEAYTDAVDPTIGHGSDSVDYGKMASSVFAFQNQMSSPLEEELALLRGVDDYFARPVYNRLFWNFTKGEGEAAYATNYNLSDVNSDGFIDEKDGMLMYPQGHGDAWGHYLTAIRNQYELLKHPYFNWVSRSESYNLNDIVISVDFLDERKFAATAAAKAKAGAEIVNMTYREKYVADPNAQWQGYTDSNEDRAWGVDETARRAGQGAYFDWVTSNALLPSVHPNTKLEGIRKVDRQTNDDIAVVSANMNAIQSTLDQADKGYNPLGIARGAQAFDFEPTPDGSSVHHFDQIFERARAALENASLAWDNANKAANMIRQIGNSEAEFKNSTFQEDLAYRNQLIQIFGKPYEGTVGPGRLYPAGYQGPDLALYMYVPVREINKDTVPGPTADFATFDSSGNLTGGDLISAYNSSMGNSTYKIEEGARKLFASTFADAANGLTYEKSGNSGLFDVNYTDLTNPRVELENFASLMPITAAGYTFQAPSTWGARTATGELQDVINQMIQQEAEIAKAIAAWDGLAGDAVSSLKLLEARVTASGKNQSRDEVFTRVKYSITNAIKIIETTKGVIETAEELSWELQNAAVDGVPLTLPTGGLAISPGDALSLARSGIEFSAVGVKAGFLTSETALEIAKLAADVGLDIAENELNIAKADEDRKLAIKEWLTEVEGVIGDEPILRVAIFKEIQVLRSLSDRYRTLLDQGGRLTDERSAFNKRVAAQTQRNRYQDMTFRVAQNHALQSYRQSFDLAARYAYLAAAAYDYETNYTVGDPASATQAFTDIIKARSIGNFADGLPRTGAGGLSEALAKLKANYDAAQGHLGFNNVQREISNISLRTGAFRIFPSGQDQPAAGSAANLFPSPGQDSDSVWKKELQKARVADLWEVPEFREYCRPFASAVNASGKKVAQPGIVLRFSSDITSGKNFFGKPLSGGDIAFSTSNFATKIQGVGVSFKGYQTDNLLTGLSASPRIYFLPTGMDIMRVSRTDNPDEVRTWKVVEQAIPTPYPGNSSKLGMSGYIPLLDSINGRFGTQRRFADFRAYPGADDVEPVTNTRLVGRSIWNTQWMLIIPGATLNADPAVGLDRFIEQVGDIKFTFDTYSQSGG